MLKLYSHPLSTYGRRVKLALLEKEIHAEEIEVDLFARDRFRSDYVAKNPYGRVPALEENGFVLYESTAILEYLEATRPTPPLLPPGEQERARVAMHMKLCDLHFALHAHKILVVKRFLPADQWREEPIARARKKIESHLSILEDALKDKTFLVAERFSLAEICYLPFLEFLPLMEITPPPGVAAWSRRLMDRPSARATKPDR